ncbi:MULTISPECIES: sugar nucleotide-binding protein [unclassified Streptomyces]|uniref:sugar nucleotide-binding protein n=1 Tax=unclassified Streptomyces TaxID=2593676 RepID=UPI002E0ED0F0|nr:sugar nucleotide-binding protein [Streptomyces sp. NBC_01197]WSS49039.1 sugar nucleotide-binding protein [Streptomyces sp. NBC_01180]
MCCKRRHWRADLRATLLAALPPTPCNTPFERIDRTTLIIGGSGFLGAELVRQACAAGRPTAATYATRPGDTSHAVWNPLDLRDHDRLDAPADEVRPRLIVNTSSGGVDWAATAKGPTHLAMIAAKNRVRMVHVSTDAVFSGADINYNEAALPDPNTPYSAAKAAAETGILAAPC